MKINSVVRVIIPPTEQNDSKGIVEKGALAIVVDGLKEFPDLYYKLKKSIEDDIDEFIFVRWIREDIRWKGRIDGAYAKNRFKEIKNKIMN
jgi:hypothetical protein